MCAPTPPVLDDILEMAEQAFAAIPAVLREMVRGTAIVVEETADDEILEEMGIENPWELTGLYRGTPLTQKSVLDVPLEPDTILLFREEVIVFMQSGALPAAGLDSLLTQAQALDMDQARGDIAAQQAQQQQ